MGPLKKDPRGRGGGGGGGGSWDHMSSNDVGSYELKRSSCAMQKEECSATLARSTSDGSADYIIVIIIILSYFIMIYYYLVVFLVF